MLRETLGAGGRACRPLIARDGLSPVLIEPALAVLKERGVTVRMEHQLRAMRFAADRVEVLDFGADSTALAPDDAVIVAVPPYAAAALVRDLTVPTEFRAIVNAHFRIAPPPGALPIMGVLGGTTEWIFAFPGAVGHHQRGRPADRLAARGIGQDDLERSRGRHRPAAGTAALADRARAPRHLRGNARAGRQAAVGANAVAQSAARRRLDRYRLTGDNRKRDPLRPSRRRIGRANVRPNLNIDAMNTTIGNTAVGAARDDAADAKLDRGIAAAKRALLACQHGDGHWVFELEPDATVAAEYVLLRHYLAEPVDAAREAKIAAYLRRIQGDHGGWPLFRDGDLDISATVKAYFALKMIGDAVDADHMRRARAALLARGGAARANVFTRIMLALYGFVPWRAVPAMPIEIVLLPKWFPFHLDKISYWSRTVIVPLLVLMAKKPRARNPKGVRIDELFLEPPEHRPDA